MGNPNVRLDLHRKVMPREIAPTTNETPVYILWTSNRHKDMVQEHWVPNHFVVVLPIDHNNSVVNEESNDSEAGLDMDQEVVMNAVGEIEAGKEDDVQEVVMNEAGDIEAGKEDDVQEVVMNEAGETEAGKEDDVQEVVMKEAGETEAGKEDEVQEVVMNEAGDIEAGKEDDVQEVVMNEAGDVEAGKDDNVQEAVMNEAGETEAGKEDEVQEVVMNEAGEIEAGKEDEEEEIVICNEENTTLVKKEKPWENIPDPEKCVGLHVIVSYNNAAYPGFVLNAGQSDLYVKCMHRLGKKGQNCFYWPKKLIDVCWYDYDSILAVIPEPTKIETSFSHFKVDDEIWKSIQDDM